MTPKRPTTRPPERCSGLFILPTWKSEASKTNLEAEKDRQAQGNLAPAQDFLRASPWWSLREPRSAWAGEENLFSLLGTAAALGRVDRKVLGQGQGPHPFSDPS